MKSLPIYATLLIVVLTASSVTSADALPPEQRVRLPGEQVVSVAGTRYGVPGAYELTVTYETGTAANGFGALLVHSQPSGTLLLAHYSPDASLSRKLRKEVRSALVSTRAPLVQMEQTVHLPFDPLVTQDRRITVTLTSGHERHLLADGVVSMENFAFSTYFYPEVLVNTNRTEHLFSREVTTQSCPVGTIEHCCEGGNNCPKQCVCCNGPSFYCDLISCTAPECLDE